MFAFNVSLKYIDVISLLSTQVYLQCLSLSHHILPLHPFLLPSRLAFHGPSIVAEMWTSDTNSITTAPIDVRDGSTGMKELQDIFTFEIVQQE